MKRLSPDVSGSKTCAAETRNELAPPDSSTPVPCDSCFPRPSSRKIGTTCWHRYSANDSQPSRSSSIPDAISMSRRAHRLFRNAPLLRRRPPRPTLPEPPVDILDHHLLEL